MALSFCKCLPNSARISLAMFPTAGEPAVKVHLSVQAITAARQSILSYLSLAAALALTAGLLLKALASSGSYLLFAGAN